METRDFRNDGFGWNCKQCAEELAKPSKKKSKTQSRLLSEGESESKKPELSNLALAKWADPSQSALICPRCGVYELIDIQ